MAGTEISQGRSIQKVLDTISWSFRIFYTFPTPMMPLYRLSWHYCQKTQMRRCLLGYVNCDRISHDADEKSQAGKYTHVHVCNNFLGKAKKSGLLLNEITIEDEEWKGTHPVNNLTSEDLWLRKANCRYWIGRWSEEVLVWSGFTVWRVPAKRVTKCVLFLTLKVLSKIHMVT